VGWSGREKEGVEEGDWWEGEGEGKWTGVVPSVSCSASDSGSSLWRTPYAPTVRLTAANTRSHYFDCHAQPEGLLVDGSSRGNSRRPYSFAIYRFFVGVLFYEVLKCYIPENKMLVGVRRIICLQRVQISTDFVQVS